MSDQLPKIDKGVPLPAARFDEGHPFAVLRKLKPGDSVFFREVIAGSNAYKVLSNRMSYLKNTQGFMLTARSVVEDETRGVRVWRIDPEVAPEPEVAPDPEVAPKVSPFRVSRENMKIEGGIPLPSRLSDRVEVGPLPLSEMRVDESIRVGANNGRELERKYNACRIRCQRFTRKHPHIKFKIAKDSDSKGQYLRIWRVN